MSQIETPKDKIDVTFGTDDPKTFVMTYAKLMRITQSVAGNLEDFVKIYIQPEVQMKLLTMFFSSPEKKIKDIEELDLSFEEGQRVADWICQHVIHFFTKGLTSVTESIKPLSDKLVLPQLPSSTGTRR